MTTTGNHAQSGGTRDTYYGSVDRSQTVTTFGDHAQIGGTRDTYHGSVDRRQTAATFGDHAQVGGSRTVTSTFTAVANFLKYI